MSNYNACPVCGKDKGKHKVTCSRQCRTHDMWHNKKTALYAEMNIFRTYRRTKKPAQKNALKSLKRKITVKIL